MKREIAALIERARKYLKTAESIASKDCESSVSRTYYAMFYCAEALLLTKGLSFSSHKGVLSGFGEHFIKSGIFSKEMGREFNRAFEKRQLADYDYTSTLSLKETENLLKYADFFLKATEKYLKSKQYFPE